MHPRQGCTEHLCLKEGFTSWNLHQSYLSDTLPKEFVRDGDRLFRGSALEFTSATTAL